MYGGMSLGSPKLALDRSRVVSGGLVRVIEGSWRVTDRLLLVWVEVE